MYKLADYEGIIVKVVRKYTQEVPVRDTDQYSLCLKTFLRCCELHDPTNGKFSTYLWAACCRTCNRAYSNEKKRRARERQWPINRHGRPVDFGTRDHNREAKVDLDKILSTLDARTAAILRSRIAGKTLRAIGKLHGISHERVNQLIRRAKEQILSEFDWTF
jgi:RNA polymerase sigma factor (sigma-70 family)